LKFKLMLLSVLISGAFGARAEDAAALKTDKDRQSYSIGVYTGKSFKKEGVEIDSRLVLKGIEDALAGQKLLMSDKEITAVMNRLASELRRNGIANRKMAAVKNLKTGTEFLAANKAKPDVVTLASGVQYRILKAGSGKKPAGSDLVLVNYRGTLLDGTEFDATDEGKPATLKISSLIPGWQEALKLMPAGSKWQIFIPTAHAYGERGVGNVIGPNDALIFDLELLEIK